MNKFAAFLSKTAYFVSVIFIGFLFFSTIHFTFVHDFITLSEDFLYELPDSRLKNLALLVLLIFLIFIISKIVFIKAETNEKKSRRVLIISLLVSGISFIVLCYWVSISKIAPYWDQANVFNSASDIVKGNYESLKDLYYQMYPQQLGLVFFESAILRIHNDYVIFQYLNAFFIASIIFLSGRLTKEITDSPNAELFVVILNFSFVPFIYYSSFIYGDIFAISASLFIGLLLIKWLKNNKIYYPILMILTSLILVPVRENSLIFLLTVSIVLLVQSIKNKKPLYIIFVISILVLPLLSNKLIKTHYENITGIKFDSEIPSISWIVMGTQGELENSTGVGYYNGYNYYSWYMNDCDKAAAAQYSKDQLNDRIKYFRDNPGYAYSFFRYKILEQWIEPTFDAIYMTVPSYEIKDERVLSMFKTERVTSINSYMNYYLTAAYFLSFVCAVYYFFFDKKYYGLLVSVFFTGIFLFSIIWEAKGRYTLPGFIILLIFSGIGASKLSELISLLRRKLNGKLDKKHNSNS